MFDISWGMNQTVNWKVRAGKDRSGNITWAAPVEIPARFEHGTRLVRKADGEQVASRATCYTTAQVTVEDMIVYAGKDWPVIDMDSETGLYDSTESYRALYL